MYTGHGKFAEQTAWLKGKRKFYTTKRVKWNHKANEWKWERRVENCFLKCLPFTSFNISSFIHLSIHSYVHLKINYDISGECALQESCMKKLVYESSQHAHVYFIFVSSAIHIFILSLRQQQFASKKEEETKILFTVVELLCVIKFSHTTK
jgi:hypothetical protein